MTLLTTILSILMAQAATEQNRGLQASMFLGARSAALQRKLPVRKQVVIVPNEATYLDEISKWSLTDRWPILFDREPLLSQFVRKFKPERIWKREPIGNGSIGDIESAMQRAVASAWNGSESIELALRSARTPPMGVVFTSTKDPARTAAVALAAGRGQLLSYISGDWGEIKDTLQANRTLALIDEVDKAIRASGVKYESIGDTIDAITMCMSLPARAQFSVARENPIAITDVVGRNVDGKRFAWAGWIFGSKAESTYMAMCSLFLERDQYWFCNTYPNSSEWSMYGLGNTLEILPQYGIDATIVDGTLHSLRLENVGGINADVVYFTSKGNHDFLDMADERTSPTWLPILDTPAALFFIHSWSLKNPSGKTTVGGTWLSRGVYAYIGSSHEPMLDAFVPPLEMLRRTMSLVPFIPASRWNEGESIMANPWRINTIGDPLMLCPPKGAVARTFHEVIHEPFYADVSEETKHAMQTAIDEPTDEHFANAIRLAIILGRDDMAQTLWNAGMDQQCVGAMSAKAVLPALFRNKQEDSFIWAFQLIKKPTRLEKDMLWHLVGMSPSVPVQLLMDHVRAPYSCDDISLIANRILMSKGKIAIISLIDQELLKAKDRNSRELKRMKKQYGN